MLLCNNGISYLRQWDGLTHIKNNAKFIYFPLLHQIIPGNMQFAIIIHVVCSMRYHKYITRTYTILAPSRKSNFLNLNKQISNFCRIMHLSPSCIRVYNYKSICTHVLLNILLPFKTNQYYNDVQVVNVALSKKSLSYLHFHKINVFPHERF